MMVEKKVHRYKPKKPEAIGHKLKQEVLVPEASTSKDEEKAS